jgi:hypothetical protein
LFVWSSICSPDDSRRPETQPSLFADTHTAREQKVCLRNRGQKSQPKPCLPEIRSTLDPIDSCFDQAAFTFGTLGFESGHLVKEAALVLTIIRQDFSDGCRDLRATVRICHQDPFKVQPSRYQLSEQGLSFFLAPPDTLDEANCFFSSFSVIPTAHRAASLLIRSLRAINVIEKVNKEFKRRKRPMQILAGERFC